MFSLRSATTSHRFSLSPQPYKALPFRLSYLFCCATPLSSNFVITSHNPLTYILYPPRRPRLTSALPLFVDCQSQCHTSIDYSVQQPHARASNHVPPCLSMVQRPIFIAILSTGATLLILFTFLCSSSGLLRLLHSFDDPGSLVNTFGIFVNGLVDCTIRTTLMSVTHPFLDRTMPGSSSCFPILA